MKAWLSSLPLVVLAALGAPAAADYLPPPKIGDLVRSDCAAVGRFVVESGAPRFVCTRVLWGDVDRIRKVAAQKDGPIEVHATGRLTAWSWGTDSPTGGRTPEDADKPGVWFYSGSVEFGMLSVQPVEFEKDIVALRDGRQPTVVFRLLQRLDHDMRRDAMESLFADRYEDVRESLHRIALDVDSHASFFAIDVLRETRLLDADRFWGRWPHLADADALRDELHRRDPGRVTRELRRAVESEKRPRELERLLCLAYDDVELSLRYLDHGDEDVRARAIANVHGLLWTLARDANRRAERDALAGRVIPLLESRREKENAPAVRRRLDRLLAKKDGVPEILRVPTPSAPAYRYDDAEERAFVIGLLTSSGRRGFVMESAGREVAKHFLEDGFARLRKAAVDPRYNSSLVWEGIGYVRHPQVFDFLAKHAAKSIPEGGLRAIGRQRNPRSVDVLRGLIEGRLRNPGGFVRTALCDALGLIRSPDALALLTAHVDVLGKPNDVAYLGALAAHGDDAATDKLVAMLRSREVEDGWDVVDALLRVDSASATEALKAHLVRAWPRRWESFDDVMWEFRGIGLENYAGPARRTTLAGELARRDPRWLADHALRRMRSSRQLARAYGAYVFQGLTGRSFGYRAWAFASERAAPYAALRRWWAEHGNRPREEWVLSYFAEKGFRMKRLHDEASLPVLVRALDADAFTQGLAIEQISVITGKYFGPCALRSLAYDEGATISWGGGGYESTEPGRAATRVRGWLRARGWLPRPR